MGVAGISSSREHSSLRWPVTLTIQNGGPSQNPGAAQEVMTFTPNMHAQDLGAIREMEPNSQRWRACQGRRIRHRKPTGPRLTIQF